MSDRHDDDDSPFWPRGNSTNVNSRILLIAIISLSFVVVVVTMLHVYARYILRRQARQRAAFRGIGIVAHIQSEEPPKRGLEPTVISSLPILMYKDIDHKPDHSSVSPECAVCLSTFEGGQMIRVLPNCNHHFHADCIDKWLSSRSSCPICRHEVEPAASINPLPREPSTRLGPASAPPLERIGSVVIPVEGTSDQMVSSSEKVNGTNSRLSSFRRMLSMDRSSRRANSCTQGENEDLERQ
ncbi:unnamed protein product [Lactuca virosa]|uniref:RING-type E3 ubiquitin transferase n=1 Tax=Lactuca virosa TaxID=75947 RepID=A0AAU9MDT9_9ASTR|nr:unnamed protein product [Lactuca virosa]